MTAVPGTSQQEQFKMPILSGTELFYALGLPAVALSCHGADAGRQAPPPAWLARLFPHTTAPNKFAHRLQRVEAEEILVGGRAVGQVTCRFVYPELDGRQAEGQVRFFLPSALREDAEAELPLLHCAGYEADVDHAALWLNEGFVVTTVHGHPLNPISRGPNLEVALLHAVRRLPFIDDTKVLLWGGSAGGYMALMLAAQTFPLVAVMPEVPPVNLCYNLAYLDRNNAPAHEPTPGTGEPRLPVLAGICDGLLQALPITGGDYESEAYYTASPAAHLAGITAPVLATFSTADMLVPINQVSADLVGPFDSGLFPKGFSNRVDDLLHKPEFKTRLFDALRPDKRQVFHVSIPEQAPALAPGVEPPSAPVSLALPFSKTRQWSIDILDEGAPLPFLGHLKHGLQPDYTAFRQWTLARGVQPEQLTPARLELLMNRYLGREVYDFVVHPEGKPAHRGRRLDYPRAEKADVIRGLRTFARKDACARRLAELYENLSAELKVFGPKLGTGTAASVRTALDE